MAIVSGHIRCPTCGKDLPLAAFSPSRAAQGYGVCRRCNNAAQKTSRERRGRAVVAAVRRAHYRANPDAFRRYNLSRYDITPVDFDELLAAQGGGCACCGAQANADGKRLFVDHDHATGAIRGVVCRKCNAGIAALGDSIEGVRRALAYLERAPRAPRASAPRTTINLLAGERHG